VRIQEPPKELPPLRDPYELPQMEELPPKIETPKFSEHGYRTEAVDPVRIVGGKLFPLEDAYTRTMAQTPQHYYGTP
jgi:hypothetical protein